MEFGANNWPLITTFKVSELDEDKTEDIIHEVESTPENRAVVLYKSNKINEISLLNADFDLTCTPANFMRKRSKIESIIYRAVQSQCTKSPFASLKTAEECIDDLDKVDIITGINCLKSVIKSAYDNKQQLSIVVHKVGNTLMLDDFQLNDLILKSQYSNWEWLKEFIKNRHFQLAKPDLSRNYFTNQALYAKFLYHIVSHNQQSITLPNSSENVIDALNNREAIVPVKSQIESSNSSPQGSNKTESGKGASTQTQFQHNEDYLNLIDWKLEDLSLIVGSDLSIFGTKSHPCISLRLSPTQEPINILTGIDIWLENLLNEVPEVAMCYHNQGIIQHEYEILQTQDIPNMSGFEQNDVKCIAKNLAHFLMNNATRQGHTYWLFKESENSMVKLYDLTNIYHQQQLPTETVGNNKSVIDNNPFIVPVAMLCYRVAESRLRSWFRARDKLTNLTSTRYNQQLFNEKSADNHLYFFEIFRLLKNCIDLLMKLSHITDQYQKIINSATMLMCRLYMEVDENTLQSLKSTSHSPLVDPSLSEFNVDSLKSTELQVTQTNVSTSTLPVDVSSHSTLELIDRQRSPGEYLFELCAMRNTSAIFNKAIELMELNNIHSIRDTDKCLIQNNQKSNSTFKPSDSLKFLESCRVFYRNQSQLSVVSINKITAEQAQTALKSALLALVLSIGGSLEQILDQYNPNIDLSSSSPPTLKQSHLHQDPTNDVIYNLLNCFMLWHVEMLHSELTSGAQTVLTDLDKQLIRQLFNKDQQTQMIQSLLLIKAVLMREPQRQQKLIQQLQQKSAIQIPDSTTPSQLISHTGIFGLWFYFCRYLCYSNYRLWSLPKLQQQSMHINQQLLLQFQPIIINILVGACVSLFKLISVALSPDQLLLWSKFTIVPYIEWLENLIENTGTDTTSELSLFDEIVMNMKLLIWSDLAKLYRIQANIYHYNLPADISAEKNNEFAGSVDDELTCNLNAVRCYNDALALHNRVIKTSSKKQKSPTSNEQSSIQMTDNLRADRLDVAMMSLELAYAKFNSYPDYYKSILMKRVLDYAESIIKHETSSATLSLESFQEVLKLKLAGLRLRLNFLRFYLNLSINKNINSDVILNELNKDLKLTAESQMHESSSIPANQRTRYIQEVALIIFYIIKIQVEKSDILKIQVIRDYLANNVTNVTKYLLFDYVINADTPTTELHHHHDTTMIRNINQQLRNLCQMFLQKSLKKRKQSSLSSNRIQLFTDRLDQLTENNNNSTNQFNTLRQLVDLIKEIIE